MSYLTYYYIT